MTSDPPFPGMFGFGLDISVLLTLPSVCLSVVGNHSNCDDILSQAKTAVFGPSKQEIVGNHSKPMIMGYTAAPLNDEPYSALMT